MSDDRRSRYSKVYRRMWTDARFAALSAAPPNGQTLWQRLLTGPELSNVPGLIMVGEMGLAEALGWELEGLRHAFVEVFRQGLAKADWKARLIFVPKAIVYNKPESPNVVRSWRTAWDEAPECPLKIEAYHSLKAFVEGMGQGFASAFLEACGDPSPNQEQEQEQEQEGGERTTASPSAPARPSGRPVRSESELPQTAEAPSAPTTRMAPKTARASRLPVEWLPSAKTIARFRTKERVDAAACVERFKNHFLAASGPNAVKRDWERTFSNWVLEDIARGRATPCDGDIQLPFYDGTDDDGPPATPEQRAAFLKGWADVDAGMTASGRIIS